MASDRRVRQAEAMADEVTSMAEQYADRQQETAARAVLLTQWVMVEKCVFWHDRGLGNNTLNGIDAKDVVFARAVAKLASSHEGAELVKKISATQGSDREDLIERAAKAIQYNMDDIAVEVKAELETAKTR